MNIAFDDIALLGPLSKNRGIGNYAFGLFKTLIKSDKENHYYMFNIMEEFSWKSYADDENIIEDFYYLGKEQFLAHEPYKEIFGKILQNFIKKNEIDIFIITSPFDGHVLPYRKEWFQNVNVVAIVYDIIPYVMKEHYLTDKNSYKWYMSCVDMLRWCDRLLVISNSVKTDLIHYLDFPADRIDVIWGAINEQFRMINISLDEQKRLYTKFGIHGKYIMCTGGDDERKNIEGLIRSYGKLSKEVRGDYQLVIVCKLSQTSVEKYHNLAIECGVENQVVLTNFASDEELVFLYNLASLMVFPSKYEGFGLPIVEAFACNVPVVTSNNSSLVEIAGDAAILVNPFSEEDVSRGILKALTNCDLEELRLKGRERLKIFQWENVAQWLLQSIHKLNVKNGEKETARKKIAFFTPLPPVESGISDYSVDIIGEINKYFDIDIFIDDGYEASGVSSHTIKIFNHRKYKTQQSYYRTIYQMGNSSYHTYMLPYISRNGGIVVLHDYNLHGALHYVSMSKRNYSMYKKFLLEDYDKTKVESYLEEYRTGKTQPQIYEMVINGAVVNYATQIIVHSEWAAEQLLRKNIEYKVHTIPHYAIIQDIPDENIAKQELGLLNKGMIIGMFGYIHETKRIFPILHAFKRLRKEETACLVCVGKLAKEIETDFNEFVSKNNLADSVIVTGYIDLEIFQKYIDAVDICLNLRYPYNGETSGSLMRILSKGKAVVVNDIGSFSEIPDDACIKLPDARDLTINHEADNIFGALKMLIADSEYRSTLRKNARLYAEKTLDLEVVGKLYKDVIELPQQASPLTENVLKGIADELAEKKYSREEVRNISDSLSACI